MTAAWAGGMSPAMARESVIAGFNGEPRERPRTSQIAMRTVSRERKTRAGGRERSEGEIVCRRGVAVRK